VGGHNPHEPQALGCQVVHGPNVWNFSESYTDLDAQGWSQLATTPADIAEAVMGAWKAPATSGKQSQAAVLGPLESLIQLAKT
jgi:3-deoxy-D-manno-octulosonic-acid transferase